MADKITYTDKEQGQVSTEPVNKRWNFGDANEVKEVVNSHADDLDDYQSDLDLKADKNQIVIIDSSLESVGGETFDVGTQYIINGGLSYDLIGITSIYNSSLRQGLIISNISTDIVDINLDAADSIILPHIEEDTSFKLYQGESYELFVKDTNTWGVQSSQRRPRGNVEAILSAQSFNDQTPVSVDTVVQVEFGAAQGTVSDPIMIDANGTITFNEEMSVGLSATAHFGRSGGGGNSELRFRLTLNGDQASITYSARLDNANIVSLESIYNELTVPKGAVVKFEFYRDSTGNNSGDLISEVSTVAGWANSPSAAVTINRTI